MYADGRLETFKLAGGNQPMPSELAPELNEFYHDYSTGDFAYPDGREIVVVGPEHTVSVRLSDIHELPQIRETISEEEIQDLAHKIVKDNEALETAETPAEISAALDLMHPPGLILLQPDELEKFLAQHADFYELDDPVVIPHNNRAVILRNEGHRRGRAVEHIIVKMKGLTTDDVAMRSTLHVGMTFPEANRRQAKENSHVQTSAIDDANNIRRQFNFIQRHEDRRPSVSEVADIYGFSENKVRTALAFTALPDSIKAFLGNDKKKEVLPFSLLADLSPLWEIYRQRYDEKSEMEPDSYPMEAREDKVLDELQGFTATLARKRYERVGSDKLRAHLETEKKIAGRALTIAAEDLFLFEADKSTPRERKITAYKRMGGKCLTGLELSADQGALDHEDIVRIEAIVARAKTFAKPLLPDNQEQMF